MPQPSRNLSKRSLSARIRVGLTEFLHIFGTLSAKRDRFWHNDLFIIIAVHVYVVVDVVAVVVSNEVVVRC